MFEKLKEKLKKIFAEKGIDEGTTEEVLVELDREEEEPKPEGQDHAPIQEENVLVAMSWTYMSLPSTRPRDMSSAFA